MECTGLVYEKKINMRISLLFMMSVYRLNVKMLCLYSHFFINEILME